MPDDPPSRPTVSPPVGPTSDEDICRYIAERCAEMRLLTRRPRLRTVNYLLDMVRIEAERTAAALEERR